MGLFKGVRTFTLSPGDDGATSSPCRRYSPARFSLYMDGRFQTSTPRLSSLRRASRSWRSVHTAEPILTPSLTNTHRDVLSRPKTSHDCPRPTQQWSRDSAPAPPRGNDARE